MKAKHILLAAVALLPGINHAQSIDFETQTWTGIGVYDTWEQSPFREKLLKGNVAVINNPTKTEIDPITKKNVNVSDKVLAVQRSRYGSNTFGARIDLKETFELTPTTQYVHVWIHRPKKGRVMVVGLGKRKDRAGQSSETEQFWAMSTSAIEGGSWKEVVLPFRGNGGIDIHSLVVVPDCESPHNLQEDFIAYIDNVSVSLSPTPQLVNDYYYINFDKKQTHVRNDRYIEGVSLTTPDGKQEAGISDTKKIYTEVQKTFPVKAGQKVTAAVKYKGSWMHAYCYLDADNDGLFTENNPKELLSYSYLSDNPSNPTVGKNSAGQVISGNARNTLAMPEFTIPENLTPGYYRLRYKVDWDNADPAGEVKSENNLLKNGGGFVDVRLNVHTDEATVNDANRNGYVSDAEGNRLVSMKVPFGKAFKIKMNPENGFEYSGIIVKYGYNLSGDSIVKGNVQWEKVRISRSKFNEDDHTFVIPGKYMEGNVEIEGLFIEKGTYTPAATRYETTKIIDGQFSKDTPWYTLQIGKEGYVLSENQTKPIVLNRTQIDTDNAAQLWCFVGDEAEGYRIYNCKAGAGKVLAAPVTMKGNKGGESYPVMHSTDEVPNDYIDVWMFQDSEDLGTGSNYAYLYQKGYPAHKINNRDKKLAFWSGGADAGSTLTVTFARKTSPTAIANISAQHSAADATIYNLDGRPAAPLYQGVCVKDGKKLLKSRR